MKEPQNINELKYLLNIYKCNNECIECPFKEMYNICDMLLEEFNNKE